jgi:hypothetical protein
MTAKLDLGKMEAAFKRAAHKALHGTREERSGRFMAKAKPGQNSSRGELRSSSGRDAARRKG